MNNKQTDKEKVKKPEEKQEYTGRTYAYVAIGLVALGAVFLGLSFTVMGIYSLIASEILQVAALTFLNVQKKKNNFKWMIVIRIISYVLLAVALVIFVGGIVWSAS